MGAPRRLGVLLGFDDHQRAAFTEHHAVAILVERAAGAGRVVVVGRQHAKLHERRDGNRLDRCVDPAADRDVGLAENDVSPRLGNGRGTRGVGEHGREHPGLGVMIQPDRGGRGVRHVHLHFYRGHRPHALCPPIVVPEHEFLGCGQREAHRDHEPFTVDVG
jgi:hypothetical protein